MENEDKTFCIKHKGGAIVSAVSSIILALPALVSTITSFSAYLSGEKIDWRNSLWITALLFVLFMFSAVVSLREVFTQLTLSKEGIWYHQLGGKRFIP